MQSDIDTWRQFAARVRARQDRLLVELHRFDDPILVTGCQRSGGTMLSRVITGSAGMTNFWFSKDEELDAAQILSGSVRYQGTGRHCFQTTYLNERWPEYLQQAKPFRMVWSLRNPHSVVYSMVYNWKRFALNELFVHCGLEHMNGADRYNLQRFGVLGVPPVRRAAYAYVGKVSQLLRLNTAWSDGRLTVLDYDQLVRQKLELLPALYQRLNLAYQPSYADPISERSLGKKEQLSASERDEVDRLCSPVFQQALACRNLG